MNNNLPKPKHVVPTKNTSSGAFQHKQPVAYDTTDYLLRSPIRFFSIASASREGREYDIAQPLFDTPRALACYMVSFLEKLLEGAYFDYWLKDAPITCFCVEAFNTSHQLTPLLFDLMGVMPSTHNMEAIFTLALIYWNRYFQSQSDNWLHALNVQRLLVCSVWLACKFLEDDWSKGGGFECLDLMVNQALESLEVEFLRVIDFNVHVSSEMYKVCYKLVYQSKIDQVLQEEADELKGLALL